MIHRCAILLMAATSMSAQITLPLDGDGLRRMREIARREGPDNARAQLQQALEASRVSGDRHSEAYALAGLAGVSELARNSVAAEQMLRDAAALAATAGDVSFFRTTALWFSQESIRGGRSERGARWAQLAAEECRAAGDKKHLARALHVLYRTSANEQERRLRLDEALAAAREAGDAVDIASIEAEEAETQRQAGDLGRAIRTLRRVTVRLEQMKAWSETGRALTLLARAYASHSEYRLALDAIHKAEALLERNGETAEWITARQELGILLAATGNRTGALTVFEQTHRDILANQQRMPSLRVRTAGLVHGYLTLGEYQKAVDLTSQIIDGAWLRTPLPVFWIRSAALFHLSRYEEAVDAATEGIQRAVNPQEVTNISAYRWRALSLEKLGRVEQAAHDMMEAASIGDAVRSRLLPDDEPRRLFGDDRLQFVHDAIAVLWRAGKHDDAWQVAEQARARAFLARLATRESGAAAELSKALTAKELSDFAKRRRETVLSYWVHPEAVYIWLTGPDGESRCARVPITSAKLQQLVERARLFHYKPDLDAWRQLHRLLIQPIAAKLPAGGHGSLSLVLHGPLLHIPFAALLSPSGRYLVEDYALRSAPAARILARGPRSSSNASFLLVGAPRSPSFPALPGALREVERIAAIAPRERRVFTGAGVQIERLRNEAPQAAVLHFATHAVENKEQPFQSFLALSDSGKLTAEAIYALRLEADLVMLTACRSGAGRISADGVLGFTRAFLSAGAAAVVAPLWDIPDDPTVRLAEAFYRAYALTRNKAVALREAQLTLLSDLRAAKVTVTTPAGTMTLPEHPALWAGFVLQGSN